MRSPDSETQDERVMRLARIACRHWSANADYQDQVQIAATAVWQCLDLEDYQCIRRARNACADRWRQVHGRNGCKTSTSMPLHIGGESVSLVTSLKSLSPTAESEIADIDHLKPAALAAEAGLEGTLKLVAIRLAEGTPKKDIAAELGVHPSRVSQHITSLREALT